LKLVKKKLWRGIYIMIKKIAAVSGIIGVIILVTISFLAVLTLIFGSCAAETFVRNSYENCEVTGKESVRNGERNRYLIFCELENGEVRVFENTDQLVYGKFNSSDVYAKIKVGSTYNFKVSGVRIPYLSWYENIIGYEEVESNELKD
jgi:hypothetical protein